MTLNIVSEPAGEVYVAILRLASEVCASFSLVWQEQLSFNSTAQVIQDALKPSFVREERTDQWPGTKLMNHCATVRYYEVSSESIRVLQSASHLYSWLSPDRPEDLALYMADGELWLGSIAHERDGWFADLPGLQTMLQKRIPSLKIVRWEPQ